MASETRTTLRKLWLCSWVVLGPAPQLALLEHQKLRSVSTRTRLELQVGRRYTLVKLLGRGSYSSVCLSVDHQRSEKVRTA